MLKWLGPVAALLAFAMPAHAQMVRAQDPQTVVKALQDAGLTATLGTDQVGDPMITSGVSGSDFQILFYNCTQTRDCATVQFHAAYDQSVPVDLTRMNQWNQSKRFARAFLNKENNPVLEMDIDLDDGGVSAALFIDNIQFWASVLVDFERHIGRRT